MRKLNVDNSVEFTAANPGAAQREELDAVRRMLESHPFRPYRAFRSGHYQTMASYFWRRRFPLEQFAEDEERLFEVEPGVRILGKCSWQSARLENPVMVIVHGLEGSADSRYMLGTGMKARAAGFNVIRLNMRTCGATEHLAPTLYNSGMSPDVRAVIDELIAVDKFPEIFVTGFSMSGNIVLKYAGEEGSDVPKELRGICAVSPSVDLAACAAAINLRSNWMYRRSFVSSLKNRIKVKNRIYPDRFRVDGIRKIKTIRDFDESYTALDGGFVNADDYYIKSSAKTLISEIRLPTMIIHAHDDPFVPIEPVLNSGAKSNPYVILLAPERGGHVGFLADSDPPDDRFWAENQIVRFCRSLSRLLPKRDQETANFAPGAAGIANLPRRTE